MANQSTNAATKKRAERKPANRTNGVAPLALMPCSREPLADQLYGQILDQIVSGRLSEGDRLPTEKEICATFGVSRPVVRDALARLRADGLVKSRQGSGTYVQHRPADRLKSFTDTATVATYLRCLEFRIPVEAASARFAAERRTAGQLEKIEASYAILRRDVETDEITTVSDMAFHMAIAEATGNRFFSDTLQQLQDSMAGMMYLGRNLTCTSTQVRAGQVLSEHMAILEAIQSQEPEMAAFAMQFHLSRTRRRLTDRKQDE